MTDDLGEECASVLRRADQLYSEQEVEAAYDRMAERITAVMGGHRPVVLSVMIGGLVPTAHLIKRMAFPLELDYLHATRYHGETSGGDLVWRVSPGIPLAGRTVLVIDDIVDEGHTLAAILDALRAQGPRELYSAMLLEKRHDRRVAGLEPSFVGLSVEDRYVFGCGMDYKGYLRQLAGVYAVGERDEA